MDKNCVLVMNVGTNNKLAGFIKRFSEEEKKVYLERIYTDNNFETEQDTEAKEIIDSYMNSFHGAIQKADAEYIILIHTSDDVCKFFTKKISEKYKEQGYDIEEVEVELLDVNQTAKICNEELQLPEYRNKRKIVNFTHGSKSMSIASFFAGLYDERTQFQYGEGVKKGNIVIYPEDNIVTFDAKEIRVEALYKQCKTLFAHQQYAAVKEILETQQCIPEEISSKLKKLSDFCCAWDRFDYASAADLSKEVCHEEIAKINYKPKEECINFLNVLKDNIQQSEQNIRLSQVNQKNNIKFGIYLLFDIYANYRRRMAAKLYEDALMRAYKMTELMGQIYLFEAGYSAGNIPMNDENVQQYYRMQNIGKIPTRWNRSEVLGFLEFFYNNTTKYQKIKDLESIGSFVEQRNNSVLIHGYSSFSPEDSDKLEEITRRKILGMAREVIKQYELGNYDNIYNAAMFLNNNFN